LTPRHRLDETAAARKPVLRWRPDPIRREKGNTPLSALQGGEGGARRRATGG
jgi:hypothetical protein